MLPSRFTPAQSSGLRKMRPDGKASFLPKPRMAGSIDRHSVETRRPSGIRSSSADPPRATISGMRLSREASATKIPVNRNSRSQQRESSRAPVTPLRSSQFSRSTITPRKTPTEDRTTRGWQTSLDRALACVTIKDQRPISNAAWQRSECHRVQEQLAERGGDGSTMTLIRPLTITRFVEIVATLLYAITRESKLNNDNYVTKIPHTAKLVLYPSTISKTWLKTVNTLHAFPQALAFIAYLMDLANYIEMPIAEEWLYIEKDELAVLQRDYLYKCWYRFQEPEQKFDDLDAEYLHNLKLLLGNDDENIAKLNEDIHKYEVCLNDESELAARADEERRNQCRFTLLTALRTEKAARVTTCATIDTVRTSFRDHPGLIKALDHDIEKANAESQTLRAELDSQAMTVEERARRLDEVDYAQRVHDSKRMLCEQITKMLFSKESELAFWQKVSLDCCVQYKQGLIHLAAKFSSLQQLAIDEQELMEDSCLEVISRSVEALKQHRAALHEQLSDETRARNTTRRQRAAALDELRSKISETKSAIQREEEALNAEQTREQTEAHEWKVEENVISQRIEVLAQRQSDYSKAEADKQFWLKQANAWKSQVSELQKYIEVKKVESKKVLADAKRKRAELVASKIKELSSIIV